MVDKKQPTHKPTVVEPVASKTLTVNDVITAAMRQRVANTLTVMIARWEESMQNPDYQPTPVDVIGAMKVMQEFEQIDVQYKELMGLLQRAKQTVSELETRLLGLLQEPKP